MPVFTCEFTHNGKRHLMTSFAEDEDKARNQGFRHTFNKMKGTRKELHEDTFKEFEYPHEAHREAVEFAKRNKLPEPGQPGVSAALAKEVFPAPTPANPPPVVDDE